jgi:hypothetical protein
VDFQNADPYLDDAPTFIVDKTVSILLVSPGHQGEPSQSRRPIGWADLSRFLDISSGLGELPLGIPRGFRPPAPGCADRGAAWGFRAAWTGNLSEVASRGRNGSRASPQRRWRWDLIRPFSQGSPARAVRPWAAGCNLFEVDRWNCAMDETMIGVTSGSHLGHISQLYNRFERWER